MEIRLSLMLVKINKCLNCYITDEKKYTGICH